MLIFGTCSIVAGLLNLLLPETMGKHLPETMAHAKNLRTRNVGRDFVPENNGRKDEHSVPTTSLDSSKP